MGILDRLFGPPDVASLEKRKDERGLIRALKHTKTHAIRSDAAASLRAIGTSASVKPLAAALSDDSSVVRATAARALGDIGARLGLKVLFEPASEFKDQPHFYNLIVMALDASKMKGFPAEAIGRLINASRDEIDAVRSAANDALLKIGFGSIKETMGQDLKALLGTSRVPPIPQASNRKEAGGLFAKAPAECGGKSSQPAKRMLFRSVACLRCSGAFQSAENEAPWWRIDGTDVPVDDVGGFLSGRLTCPSCSEVHTYVVQDRVLTIQFLALPHGYTGAATKRFEPVPASGASDKESNLTRWQTSGWPKRWAEEHRYSWNHQDWLSLLEDLRKSPYWPMDPDKVGAVVEETRRRSVCEVAVSQKAGFINIKCPSCGSKCQSRLRAEDPVLESRIWGADCPTCGHAFNFKAARA